eukprot:SAG11_NODE_2647_length_3132_cov_3.280910_2_plen_254_part_00
MQDPIKHQRSSVRATPSSRPRRYDDSVVMVQRCLRGHLSRKRVEEELEREHAEWQQRILDEQTESSEGSDMEDEQSSEQLKQNQQHQRWEAPSALFSEAMRRIFEGMYSRAKAYAALQRMDTDLSGTINANEMRSALKLLDLHLSPEQAATIVSELDGDGDGEVDISEFMELVWKGKLRHMGDKIRAGKLGHMGDWAKLFSLYDRDNSGGLDFDEFRRAVRKDAKITSSSLLDDELREIFDHIDSSGYGASRP